VALPKVAADTTITNLGSRTDEHLVYYGLYEEPFVITGINHRFCYLSAQHRTVVERCLGVIDRRLGFGIVQGAVGTGKSTLAHLIYSRLQTHPEYTVAFNNDPAVPPSGFIRNILAELKQPNVGRQLDQLKNMFREFVYEQVLQEDKNVVLLIDEAQTMEARTLELVRVLLNYEGERGKFVQVIFFGQEELSAKLKRYKNIQNRIMSVAHLEPLDRLETQNLIEYRLYVAGRKKSLFSAEAIDIIQRSSGGIPRSICAIADESVRLGYEARTEIIEENMAREAAQRVVL
jgi:type II secretory pathway predicted ATPase ExeA